ncbi:MAG: hypothetical protein GWP91_15260 [Rhodobacterales bacterium]|nr:hypothetical protein [Rhodobacterales bacterium]
MRVTAVGLTLSLCLLGCASSDKALYFDSATMASDPSTQGATDTSSTAPPEIEDDDFFSRPPAQTPTYVFVTNPLRDTVTRVNAQALSVITQSVGADPQFVQTTDDHQTAVVFNRGGDSISVLDVDSMDQRVVPVRDNMNAMRLSPSGQFAVLWHDQAAESSDDPPAQGLESFNEASFVDLVTGDHYPMAVGFNPREVVFNSGGDVAAVVSDEYLAIVHLDQPPLVPVMIRLSEDVDPPRAEEVLLTPDGSYAFVRQFGAEEILFIDMDTEALTPLRMGLNPTDFDLSEDGSELVVVCRGSEELWVVDLSDPLRQPSILATPAGVSLGSLQLSADGNVGVLYTTASLVDRYAVWDRGTDEISLHGLIKPVSNVMITPDGSSMLVVHTLSDTPDADVFGPFFGHWALTTVDLTDLRSNPLQLPAQPIGFANSTSGEAGYFIMDGENYLERIDYLTLLHDEITLKSPPVYVGVLPDADPTDGVESYAWVSQEHDLGRISFYDPSTSELETITGFELNSEIEQ